MEVIHWGAGGGMRDTRLLPEHLDAADAVVSIDKTVQYSLSARVPVYVYDHLGDPGWLGPAHFAACAHANFSGRCCGWRLEAPDIAREIKDGFAEAARTAAKRTEADLAPYALETQITLLSDALATATPAEDRLRSLVGTSANCWRANARWPGRLAIISKPAHRPAQNSGPGSDHSR